MFQLELQQNSRCLTFCQTMKGLSGKNEPKHSERVKERVRTLKKSRNGAADVGETRHKDGYVMRISLSLISHLSGTSPRCCGETESERWFILWRSCSSQKATTGVTVSTNAPFNVSTAQTHGDTSGGVLKNHSLRGRNMKDNVRFAKYLH